MNSLHVDDVNVGTSSFEASYNFCLKTKQKFAAGEFNLRKLRSNSLELEHIVTKKLLKDVSNKNYILGLQWDKINDKFFLIYQKIVKNSGIINKKKFK